MKVLATALGTALAAGLYAIGWLIGIVAVAVKWCWSAVMVGYADAHRLALTRRERVHAPAELRPIPTSPGKAA